ncbi:uncharacterized protein TNCV_3140681 [Trichonephila clavipes]|nr:uncharacterized protein TNCV_3140681 [Trichonephila clavipes]
MGDEELDSESHVRVEKNGASSVTSTVKMTLERDDLGAKIECHVDNEAIDDALVSWVEVDLHVGPSSLEVEGPTAPVTAGDFVTLTCTIEGAKPAANATWFNRSDVLNTLPQTEIELAPDGTFTTVSTVEVPVSRHDHQGTYYCKGSNSVLQSKGEAPLLKSLDIQVLSFKHHAVNSTILSCPDFEGEHPRGLQLLFSSSNLTRGLSTRQRIFWVRFPIPITYQDSYLEAAHFRPSTNGNAASHSTWTTLHFFNLQADVAPHCQFLNNQPEGLLSYQGLATL